MASEAMDVWLLVPKESRKSRFDSYSAFDHIPYYLSGFLEVAGCNTSFTAFPGIYVVVNFYFS